MTTQVMSPITEAHIRRCGGEIGLERERAECRVSVAGETYGITVASQSAPSMENHRAAVLSVQAHVVEEHVVAPERLRESVDIIASQVLLPVNPPEVHALLLALADNMAEHRAVECRVLQHPRYAVARNAHVGLNLAKVVLIAGHTVCRVQVQAHLQSLSVHPADESLGVGNKLLVPCPSRPSV